MKGSLHTDELMAAVVHSATGLRTARRVSHVFVLDVAAYPRPLFVTDAAINIAPTLSDKVDIVQNAIDLAHVLGIETPRAAILSAVETVNSNIPSTLVIMARSERSTTRRDFSSVTNSGTCGSQCGHRVVHDGLGGIRSRVRIDGRVPALGRFRQPTSGLELRAAQTIAVKIASTWWDARARSMIAQRKNSHD